MTQPKTYVWMNDCGTFKVGRSDVSLDSVVYQFWDGVSPESICRSFPTLTLEEAYGAIAYYLAHRDEVDAYLRRQDERWVELKAEMDSKPDPVRDRLRALLREEAPQHP
jgi:hypothetical protein